MMLTALLLLAAAPLEPGVEADPEPSIPLSGQYDPQNAFARIIRGELPVAKVYEDRHLLAFMDRAPISAGHVLIISKTAKARTLLDLPDRDLRRILKLARRVGRAEIDGLGAAGFRLIQNNGYGQSVPHFHLHVVPRYPGAAFNYAKDRAQGLDQLEPVAARIRGALR
ncbi:HIT family protein [Sphingomonas jatrophae]|uniref:Histidine triad (HIT) family protein n=1 Tax=Sphingomonas jatrophae TaxID=1166337 RepID=A0A1I6JQH9_9SPHN|nr:HIT family protein [Sphingomonas jatrophae]SFR81204.1 histidine triad (HIT) family protein [Sphingomonas jatrophae]